MVATTLTLLVFQLLISDLRQHNVLLGALLLLLVHQTPVELLHLLVAVVVAHFSCRDVPAVNRAVVEDSLVVTLNHKHCSAFTRVSATVNSTLILKKHSRTSCFYLLCLMQCLRLRNRDRIS